MVEKIIKSAVQAIIFGLAIAAVQYFAGSFGRPADLQLAVMYFAKITGIYFVISVVFDLLFKKNR